jgi:hypothetical protein
MTRLRLVTMQSSQTLDAPRRTLRRQASASSLGKCVWLFLRTCRPDNRSKEHSDNQAADTHCYADGAESLTPHPRNGASDDCNWSENDWQKKKCHCSADNRNNAQSVCGQIQRGPWRGRRKPLGSIRIAPRLIIGCPSRGRRGRSLRCDTTITECESTSSAKTGFL